MKKGFTLVELLTAIFIIAVLSAIVLPQLNGGRIKSRDTKRITDLKNLQVALERYFDKHGEYPDTRANVAVSGENVSCYTNDVNETVTTFGSSGLGNLVSEKLISSLPKDPKNINDSCYLYMKGADCTTGPHSFKTMYVLLFKPENIDTFGNPGNGERGEFGVLKYGNHGWLCLDQQG